MYIEFPKVVITIYPHVFETLLPTIDDKVTHRERNDGVRLYFTVVALFFADKNVFDETGAAAQSTVESVPRSGSHL